MNNTHHSLIFHLTELRDAILRSVVTIFIIFISLFYFSNDIYEAVAAPLIQSLPSEASMIATDVASPFITPIKLTLFTSLFISTPFILNQIWQFMAPALYKHEIKLIFPLLFSSVFLFYLGVAFAYFVLFPLAFTFFTTIAPEGVIIATDIGSYLDFVLSLFFAFGIAFQVPIVTLVLFLSGTTSVQSLKEKRAYVIVSVFIIGMILTPPDIISQTLLAMPMWGLFEIGLLIAKIYTKNNKINSKSSTKVTAN